MSEIERAKKLFLEALAFVESLDLQSAESRFREVLQILPGNVSALTNLAVVLQRRNKIAEARTCAEQAIAGNANNIEALLVLASCHVKEGNFPDALAAYDQVVAIDPQITEAHNNRGIIFEKFGMPAEALESFDRAIALEPGFTNPYLHRGAVLRKLKRHDEAISNYGAALAQQADLAEAWLGCGSVYADLDRHDEAIAAYDKAIALRPNYAEAWIGRGNAFCELNRLDEALATFNHALALKPDMADAWLGRGNVFYGRRRHNEAFAAYNKALAFDPEKAEAWLGRGNVFYDLKRNDEAIADYEKALAINPGLVAAWIGCGNICADQRRDEEAFVAYERALALKPDSSGVEGDRFYIKMRLCDWRDYDAECAHLITAVNSGNVNSPLALLGIPSSPADQLQCAKLWTANKHPPSGSPLWQGARYSHDRIRVAYLSADFRQYTASRLIAGMFECHDKSRFETTAISWGPGDESETRARIRKSMDRFADVRTQSDANIAEIVRELEIDIAVDLMGFTQSSRTSIFARRPAPIQVNYFGYLGTMGAEYIDYIIADRIALPESQRVFYSEKVAYLPNSFLVGDRGRGAADSACTRAEAGLPHEGFVFCCFNNNYKITPDVFEIWMWILKQVEGSVLWLVGGVPTMEHNLRSEAAARGVDAERLVFAQRLPLPEYQARLGLADLFLDTLPYNAGAAAGDALWAGLPVLTRSGDTLTGRTAASLLNAVDLPELITETPQQYEAMAITLATQPARLAEVKQKLEMNLPVAPLFDTKLFTRHIEAAYIAMHERHQSGLPPAHIRVPN